MEEAQEQPKSNGLLVKLHAKLVTVLWIIMGLDMKSIKPLTLFDTTVMLCSLALFVLVCFNNMYLVVHGNFVQTPPGIIVLCFGAKHFTLTLLLFLESSVCAWKQINCYETL